MNRRTFLTTCAAALAAWLLPGRAGARVPPPIPDGTLWVDAACGDVLRREGGEWRLLGYLVDAASDPAGLWSFHSVRPPYVYLEGATQDEVTGRLREALAFYDRTRPWWQRKLT